MSEIVAQTSTRVAFNTVIQYVRMIINVFIGLYSVRIILKALGAEDYGIYDVVAGVIGLLGFIQASLSQTSIRFISVSIGKGETNHIKETFNHCFWLHLIIAVTFCALLIIVGTFLFDGFLNIPDDRIFAARSVYYCMVITLFFQILSTPFQALIISREQFLYIALIAIMDSLLKLVTALVVLHFMGDKLVLYGALMMLIALLNVIIYLVICFVKHRNSFGITDFSSKGVKSVSSFAGWTLMDVFGTVITRQGYAVMLNKFFGPIVNAAFALARQLEGQIYTISASVIDTMKPQIMISHGSGDDERMLRLSLTAGKIGFSMMALVAVPLIILMPDVLALWLTSIPEGAVSFARLLIIACMMEQQTRGLVYANQAIGNIKWFSIIVSFCRLIALPISCIFIYKGYSAVAAIVIFVVCETIGSLSRVVIISKLTSFNIKDFVIYNILMLLLPICTSVILGVICSIYLEGWSRLIVTTLTSIVMYVSLLYLCGLTKDEKNIVHTIVKRVLEKMKR